jgi:hypothetical protein
MDKPKIVIAIDPDVEASGLAVLDVETKRFTIVKALPFVNLVNMLSLARLVPAAWELRMFNPEEWVVVLEDSDSTTNWHLDDTGISVRSASAIGHNVGMCHATQRHILEFAESFGYKVDKMRPLKKCWLGRDGKITQDEISQFVPDLPKKINQECRDACLLAWSYANLPIRIPPEFYQTHQRKGLTTQTKGKYKVCDGRMTAEEFRKALGLKVDEK